MSDTLVTRKNMSAVTLVIGRHRATRTLAALFEDGVPFAMMNAARGTLIQDKWYHSLLPTISPELTKIQLVVPDPDVDNTLALAARHARLDRPGTGIIYSIPCSKLHAKRDFPLWPLDTPERPEQDASVNIQENLTSIHFISQGERTDAVCRAAMAAGSHGPVVQYTEGHGLRDRLGWLRITSKPIKEKISLLVENVDADLVFSAMADAGQVTRPAHGLVYRMPVQKGLINIDSIHSETRHAASIPQIIRAIDDLKASKDWRERDELVGSTGGLAGLTAPSKPDEASTPKQQRTLLSLVVGRDHARQVSLDLLDYGAPGANIDFLQLFKGSAAKPQQELAHIRCVLDRPLAREIETRILTDLDLEMMVYCQPISDLRTYARPKRDEDAVMMYRGSRVS